MKIKRTDDMKNFSSKSPEDVRQAVRTGYGEIAKSGGSCCGTTPSCCGSTPVGSEELARHVGYSAEELAALPDGANMGLSCGNPNALAALKPGEIVLDLGSGGGFDVFIAGKKVGATGRAIGVDMTAEMLEAQREWLPQFKGRSLRVVPAVAIPKNVKRVGVPTDPALAIANRFGELATRKLGG